MNDVGALLESKNIEFKRVGKDYLVHCLNPDHEDNKPSLRIDAEEGVYHCLSCGFRGNIFSLFNKHRNVFNSKVRKVRQKLIEIRRASWAGYEIPHGAFFISEGFSGLSVKKFKAFETSEMGMEDRLVFPLFDSNNRIIAFQGRYKFSDAPPKYLNFPREVALPWTPNQYGIDSNSIILVEGLRDMVYLHHHGITNAVCIFGTKSVNYDNILEHMTPYILKGVDTVYIMMDGDTPGRSAAKHLENCIVRKTELVCEIIDLAEGDDPATLDSEQLRQIKQHYGV